MSKSSGKFGLIQNTINAFQRIAFIVQFELTKAIPESILNSNADIFNTAYTNIEEAYHSSGLPFEDAILLSNHDMNRIRSTLGGDIAKAKLAASILLTLPGTPYIYYGEEIGMLGVKPDIHLREPFMWGDKSNPDPSWEERKYSIPPDVESLEAQKGEATSIYEHYKKWIQLRKENPELLAGKLTFKNLQNNSLIAYTMEGKNNTYWVLHNLSDKEIKLPFKDDATVLSTGQKMKVDEDFVLAPYTSALIKMGK
jgi:glycosidase